MLIPEGSTIFHVFGARFSLYSPTGIVVLAFNPSRNPELAAILTDPVGKDLVIVSVTQVTVDGTTFTVWRSPAELIEAAMPPEGPLPTVAQLRARAARLATWLRQPAQHTVEECGDEMLRLVRLTVRVLEGRTEE